MAKKMKTMVAVVKSLGKFINETALLSVKGSGRPAANQFVLTFENGQVFKSYRTLIAARTNKGEVYCVNPAYTYEPKNGGYSQTTQTYLGQFLKGVNLPTFREKVASGEYTIVESY